MTADAPDARGVADLVALTLPNVESVLGGLANLSAELQRAPFFIRSLVEKELSGATDLSLPSGPPYLLIWPAAWASCATPGPPGERGGG